RRPPCSPLFPYTTLFRSLPDHPDHPVARRQMRAFGGMLSFEVEGGSEGALQTIHRLRFCSLAPTLGDVDTLVLHPASSSHVKVRSEEHTSELQSRENLVC